MAVFETMRENTKVVLWITVIAFVGLIFLAWGADWSSNRGGGSQAERGVMAKVNDERVMYNDYRNAIQEAWEGYEQSTGNAPDERTILMFQARIWENLIEEALIRDEIKKYDVTASDEEIANALANNPPRQFLNNPNFQTDGEFDIAKYQGWLISPQVNTVPLERQMRQQVLREKVQIQKLAGVKVSDAEVRESWLEQNEKVNLNYALISYHRIDVGNEVADNVLQAYLDEHSDDFKIGNMAALEYIKIEKTITEQDSLDAYAEINEAYQELQRGEDFRVLVMAYSAAPPARSGGESGILMTREQISQPTIATAAFTLAVDEVSEIISSRDGYHIIKVEEKVTEEEVEKVKFADIFIPVEMTETSNGFYRDLAIDLADSTAEMGFSEAAAQMNLTIQKTGLFDPDAFIPGLGRIQLAGEFAKNAEPGEISKPVQTLDAWYMLQLTERSTARAATLQDVRASVTQAYLLEQRQAQARTSAEAVLALVNSGQSLEEAATTDSLAIFNSAEGVTRLGYIRGLGSDPAITGAVFTSSENNIPYVITGTQGAFLIEITSRDELDETLYLTAKDEIRNQLLREKQNRVINKWITGLRETAEIQDYRITMASM